MSGCTQVALATDGTWLRRALRALLLLAGVVVTGWLLGAAPAQATPAADPLGDLGTRLGSTVDGVAEPVATVTRRVVPVPREQAPAPRPEARGLALVVAPAERVAAPVREAVRPAVDPVRDRVVDPVVVTVEPTVTPVLATAVGTTRGLVAATPLAPALTPVVDRPTSLLLQTGDAVLDPVPDTLDTAGAGSATTVGTPRGHGDPTGPQRLSVVTLSPFTGPVTTAPASDPGTVAEGVGDGSRSGTPVDVPPAPAAPGCAVTGGSGAPSGSVVGVQDPDAGHTPRHSGLAPRSPAERVPAGPAYLPTCSPD